MFVSALYDRKKQKVNRKTIFYRWYIKKAACFTTGCHSQFTSEEEMCQSNKINDAQ